MVATEVGEGTSEVTSERGSFSEPPDVCKTARSTETVKANLSGVGMATSLPLFT